MSAVGALDLSIEFAGTGQQDKELHAALLAGLLEKGGELSPAIDLEGAQGKRQTTLEGVEVARPCTFPTRDHSASLELLQHHLQSVDRVIYAIFGHFIRDWPLHPPAFRTLFHFTPYLRVVDRHLRQWHHRILGGKIHHEKLEA
jgi:hypothetical protein